MTTTGFLLTNAPDYKNIPASILENRDIQQFDFESLFNILDHQ